MQQPQKIIAPVTRHDAWGALRNFTNARIALGRTGTSIPLEENLQFRADHAHARDAVYAMLDAEALGAQLLSLNLPVTSLNSMAQSRQQFLQRPDLGRRLDEISQKKILQTASYDVVFIIADGLSAKAVQLYTQPVLQFLTHLCVQAGLSIAPIAVVQQARVAISDEIGMLCNASLAVILIGERPGLSSPHSMGIYITYKPSVGHTDESRYCISNIHTPGGLSAADAAHQAFTLIQQSLTAKISGVHARMQKQLPF